MVLNRRIAGALIGGGVAVSLFKVVGVKIKDSVNYKAQVQKWAKVKAKFKEGVSATMEGWYLPTWQNDGIWKRQHERFLRDTTEKEKFNKLFPTSTSFRDHCYRHAQNTGFDKCTGSEGWCMECGRDSTWKDEAKLMEE